MKKDSIRFSAMSLSLSGAALAHDVTKDDIGKALKKKLGL